MPEWSLAPVVDALIALRGVDKLAAIVLLAELGDISRFDSPKQLMAFLGLVPREHTSGPRRRQGGHHLHWERACAAHAGRVGLELRLPARQTMHLERKAVNASESAKKIAWSAQKHLCGPYRTLTRAGKSTKVVVRGHRPRAGRLHLGYRAP